MAVTSGHLTILLFQKAILIGLFHIKLDCYLIVCESGSKNALYFRFIRRALRRLVNGNFVFPITINSQPQAMIQLLLCSLLAMPRLCNYLCRWQWLSSVLADSLQLYHRTRRCTLSTFWDSHDVFMGYFMHCILNYI